MRFHGWISGVAFVSLFVACSSGSSDTPPPDSGSGLDDSSLGDSISGEIGDDGGPETGGFPQLISQQTLYSDFANKTIAPNLVYYEPAYALWVDAEADGTTDVVQLTKRRWIDLPAGQQINTDDMDHWIFPVGTKFWKEFSLNGKLIETRLIERTSADLDGYRFGAYIWKEDQSDATWSQAGLPNAGGTDHDVPNLQDCQRCHEGTISRINSFQAIQLSKPSGVNIDWLVQNHWLSNPPPAGTSFPVPGNPTEQAALGYLHANCGHCHNEQNDAVFSIVNQVLRLKVANRDVQSTTIFKTTVNVPTMEWKQDPAGNPFLYRIWSGQSAKSAIPTRMSHRGDTAMMPPIATKHPDPNGLAAVKAWIDSLPKIDPPMPDAGTDTGPGDASSDTADAGAPDDGSD